MDDISLSQTLFRIVSQGGGDIPSYNVLYQDYVKFHFIIFICGAIFLMLLLSMTAFAAKRVLFNARQQQPSVTRFEKRAFWLFVLAGIATSSIMLVIVLANLSTVIEPHQGFVRTFPDMHVAPSDARGMALHEEVKLWLESEDPKIPLLLQEAVRDRLSWQKPKAAISGLLLVILSALTALIWTTLLRRARLGYSLNKPSWVCLTALGIVALPIDFLLMLMLLANTQASLAPLMLTLISA